MKIQVQCPGCGRRFPIGETDEQIEAVRAHVALHEQFRDLNPKPHVSSTDEVS